MEILLIAMIVLLGMLTAVLAALCTTQRRAAQRLTAEKAAAEETTRAEMAARIEAERELAALRARTEAEMEALRRRAAEEQAAERERREKAEETLRLQFRDLATEILGEQTQRFRQTSQESIDVLLKPFRDNITEFRKRVEEIYTTQTTQRGELKNELQRLMELNRTISTEAQNLTNALKGNSKVQGDWGEMLLETILSNSNLIRGIHYQTQDTQKDETGANVRPDVVLNLPDRKQIVIDSKTSLTAFTAYTSCESEEERKHRLRDHIESVRKHVTELASKNYQALMNCSPDFVIMFVPNEPAFLAALQNDPTIWADAYKKKVVISSPTNIFALLKLVDNLWQRSDLERNTREIADCGSKIYDQLVAFTESLTNVDRGLKQAQRAYDDAYKRFTTGNSNLVRLGERMVGLHIKIRKGQPKQILDTAELDDPTATAALPPATNEEETE